MAIPCTRGGHPHWTPTDLPAQIDGCPRLKKVRAAKCTHWTPTESHPEVDGCPIDALQVCQFGGCPIDARRPATTAWRGGALIGYPPNRIQKLMGVQSMRFSQRANSIERRILCSWCSSTIARNPQSRAAVVDHVLARDRGHASIGARSGAIGDTRRTRAIGDMRQLMRTNERVRA
jgi:hypothetical protein